MTFKFNGNLIVDGGYEPRFNGRLVIAGTIRVQPPRRPDQPRPNARPQGKAVDFLSN